jgi:hypothetical protein
MYCSYLFFFFLVLGSGRSNLHHETKKKGVPCITDCVLAELEKLGVKYRMALRVARDPRFERLPCSHKGTYADDCLVQRVTQVGWAYFKKENWGGISLFFLCCSCCCFDPPPPQVPQSQDRYAQTKEKKSRNLKPFFQMPVSSLVFVPPLLSPF